MYYREADTCADRECERDWDLRRRRCGYLGIPPVQNLSFSDDVVGEGRCYKLEAQYDHSILLRATAALVTTIYCVSCLDILRHLAIYPKVGSTQYK